jgi:ligand-binding sensor domain-containing protein/AraC-like DNA-binding protein
MGKPLQAQELQASLSHYSTDNGLASNAIAFIAQDGYGYLWLATWNGLSRFDGYNFYNYKTGTGSQIPNLHNRIKDVTIDNLQNVWLHMYDNRVFVLKRSVDKIVNPFEGISGSDEYRSDHRIVYTSSGYVLVIVDGVGLYRLRFEGDRIASELIVTGGMEVTSMAEGYQNDVWLGTNQGVHRMDIQNLTIERKGLFLDEHVNCLYSNGYNIFVGTQSGKIMSFSYGQEPSTVRPGGLPITALFVDSHRLVWFTDTRQGALRLNPDTGNEKLFEQRVVVPDYDGRGGSFRETDGTVWVRMNHGGYGYYNRETDNVEYFHNDPANVWNLSNTVNACLEMKEGVVWESTSRRGLDKLEIVRRTIERRQLHPGDGPSMGNEIRAMYYDDERRWLLIGNKLGELFIYRNDSCKTVLTRDSKGNPFGRIYGVAKSRKGCYWISSKDNGVFRVTPQQDGSFDIQNYRHVENSQWTLSSNAAYITQEDQEGNIWVATFGGGVNLLTPNSSGQMMAIHPQNAMKNYPYNSYLKVRSLTLDRDGNVWAGTTDGILIMSYRNKKIIIKRLETPKNDPDHALMSSDVVCLARDHQGDIWVGTNGGGLAHTIGCDEEGHWLFEHFGSADGLPSEEIRSITFDARGNVWFATDHVLCSFDVDKRIFTTFSSLDGVDETMCSEGAAVSRANGNILFGTLNGYYVVDRGKLTTATGNVLRLRITDFWLDNELQSPRLTDTYDYYVPDSKSVTLPDHSSLVSFRFASLNYQLQHLVHYQYMLEGYEHEWQNADRTRRVSYSNLPSGTYRFRVKAFLLESPEKYDLKEIEVVVPPHFLFTSNVIWLCTVLVAVLLIGMMFYRRRLLAAKERDRQLNDGPRPFSYDSQEDVVFMQKQHEYMEVHIADASLTPSVLADLAGMDVDAYSNKLYKITQQTPRQFINEYRINRALNLLTETDISIADIVFRCGFSDVSAFNRQLKAKTGMTPSQYRDQHHRPAEEKKRVEAVESEEIPNE